METMINTSGLSYGIFSGWALHWAFGTFWIIGAILFVAWAIKNLNGVILRNWAIALFILGIIGTIVTAPADIAVWRAVFSNKHGMMGDAQSTMMMQMMGKMMEHDRGANGEEGEEHGDMMQMMRMMMGSPQGGMMNDTDEFGTFRDEHHESSASSL